MGCELRSVVVVRGAGDLATGVIARLTASGFLVIALETEKPTAIRRKVSLSECMYDGSAEVEGVLAVKVRNIQEALSRVSIGLVPVIEDPDCQSLSADHPMALVDAILAKRNLGTTMSMAPIVIALGPGFVAGIDAHAVVETNRGHDLGRVILSGPAETDTGTPGMIAGYSYERVIRAPIAGEVEILRDIGSIVHQGDPVLAVLDRLQDEKTWNACQIVRSPLSGMIRGMIRGGSLVNQGTKIADVDPRGSQVEASRISDKARAIAGGVLEALLHFGGRPE